LTVCPIGPLSVGEEAADATDFMVFPTVVAPATTAPRIWETIEATASSPRKLKSLKKTHGQPSPPSRAAPQVAIWLSAPVIESVLSISLSPRNPSPSTITMPKGATSSAISQPRTVLGHDLVSSAARPL
jgi:hypothetical protein